MAEYIDKEVVDKVIDTARKMYLNDYGAVEVVQQIKSKLYNMPNADVQPIKHGRWETWGYVFHGIEWKRCSMCGKPADVSYIALLEGRIKPATLSLCGCCGAKMDDTETIKG